ncbi:GTP-binding protein [Pseudolysinimonas yzui]|uniref:GTP-binding protein n=1 Tax=Pseudolysinimonas yzui TaxID=2708254 RepID=A0A8J3M252_9MICO|nr:ATP/GTP-binding protein [Pseudolysinimonas yzui]GHF21736.1 GTP-binding protein [Pseudolysinimonas yzui]
MAEHVILFTGPMGAGKTTAIQSLSEIDVVRTEANNSERHIVDKATTTVALDYGEILVGSEEKVRLYGIPGQKRFNFMWTILKKRAKGMILLVNADAPDPLAELTFFLDEFRVLYDRGGVVIGVTRADVMAGPTLAEIYEALERTNPGLVIPVFTVDPRERDQMQNLLLTLVVNIEMRAAFGMPSVAGSR